MKRTVICHSGNFDGQLCASIARRLDPDASLVLWGGLDSKLTAPTDGEIIVVGLSIEMVFGKQISELPLNRITWIDYHQEYIESHPKHIAGYRIQGVPACCLAWQWLSGTDPLPKREQYMDFSVQQPLVLRLVHEYNLYETPFAI